MQLKLSSMKSPTLKKISSLYKLAWVIMISAIRIGITKEATKKFDTQFEMNSTFENVYFFKYKIKINMTIKLSTIEVTLRPR